MALTRFRKKIFGRACIAPTAGFFAGHGGSSGAPADTLDLALRRKGQADAVRITGDARVGHYAGARPSRPQAGGTQRPGQSPDATFTASLRRCVVGVPLLLSSASSPLRRFFPNSLLAIRYS